MPLVYMHMTYWVKSTVIKIRNVCPDTILDFKPRHATNSVGKKIGGGTALLCRAL